MLSSLTSILNALVGKPLPVYGKGNQIRDWLYVEDHVRALVLVALEVKVGETYYIGGHNEKQNIEVVQTICSILPLIIQSIVFLPCSIKRHLMNTNSINCPLKTYLLGNHRVPVYPLKRVRNYQ